MKKKIIISFIVLILIGISIAYLLHHFAKKPQELPTITVQKGTIIEKSQAIGYIKPAHSSTVKSPVDGSVAEIYHEAGDYVHKGDVLLKVKPEPNPSEYANTYQNLQQNLGIERESLKSLLRYEKALHNKLITTNFSEYIDAQKTYSTSKEQRILAEQQLALLDKGVAKVGQKEIANTVLSPVDGYILTRNVDIGDPVISLSSAQSATPLFTVANMNDLMFEGSVDEKDATKIKLNMKTDITVAASSQKISGIISKIALQSEQENATKGVGTTVDENLPFNVSFKIEVHNIQVPANFILRSGYSAVADIITNTVSNVLILPERALHFKNDKTYVLLAAKMPDQKPLEQPVTIGATDGINAEIKSGLKENDQVLDRPDLLTEDEK